jgi:hypothetical protein
MTDDTKDKRFDMYDLVTRKDLGRELCGHRVFQIVSITDRICQEPRYGITAIDDNFRDEMGGFKWGDLVKYENPEDDSFAFLPETFKSWAVEKYGGYIPDPALRQEQWFQEFANMVAEYVDYRLAQK